MKIADLNEKYLDQLILLDIDGTIVEDGADQLSASTEKMVANLRQRHRVLLVTNSRNDRRNQKIADQTGLILLTTPHRKPSLRVIEELIDYKPESSVVIGDKFITDGLFARNIGAEFIRVERVRGKNEPVVVRLSYWLDDLIWRILTFKRKP